MPITEGSPILQDLNNLLQVIINNSQDAPKNVQHNNAQNAVLFEAINLAIHLDSNSQICMQAAVLLGRYISSKETNVRYLGLETMAHLAACADSLEPIKKHQETIILSLRDKDISVRRRGLDLLYSMCDTTNSKIIVSELLRYLHIADYALREEMVLKIAILTEKFATEYSWYVDIILQLISSAGDHVGEEVWYRVVQIVTNNEDLQEYAAKTVLNYLKSPQYNETMVKVGGYILGEFGHLIANMPGCSPIEQFNSVHAKFGLCSLQTRALLLSTYVKFINLFPEIKAEILTVFNQYRHVLDAELQQRACEYIAIATMPTDDMLQTVCEEMPPFPERESTLLLKLNEKQNDTEDKRTWYPGGREANMERQEALKQIGQQRQSSTDSFSNQTSTTITPSAPPMPHDDTDLLGLGELQGLNLRDSFGNMVLTPGYDKWFNKLQYMTEGVLYEDANIQIGVKSEYHGHLGRIALYFGNKTQATLSQFLSEIENIAALTVMNPQPPTKTVPPLTQVQQLLNVECNDFFREAPSIRITFTSSTSGPQSILLKLPLVLTKFSEPIQNMDGASFFSRWKQIGGAPREAQVVFRAVNPIDLTFVKNMLAGYRFGLLEGVDPNAANMVAASVVHAGKAGKVGALLRLEPNVDQQMYRLTVRTTSELVSEQILVLLERALTYEA
ncbi:adaptin N terminal region-domain-containing protein [Endogone sp. FLAS-F59071]|nr:adaptin N terminal region-domain-containing protein [Endogone sp. FLAS-F59071]|eukprot:RUS23367.1 adaptin N terminal region-domain-containing protein [Endogone sp. FLAS-F59071]